MTQPPATWAEQLALEDRLLSNSRRAFLETLIARAPSQRVAANLARMQRSALGHHLRRFGLSSVRDQKFIACANEGLTMTQAATRLGVHHATVWRAAQRLHLTFRAGTRGPCALSMLTEAERADYDILRLSGGLSRNAALRSIGRADVVGGAS